MTKASDNAFPSILITEGTEPSAPAAGKQRLYIDSTTHKLKRTDSSGVDVTIESAGGSVATDAIFDAKGDLAVGTGADTAAKLSVGTNDFFPVADSAAATGIRWNGRATCRKTGDESKSATAYADSTNMTLPLLANKNYAFKFLIFYTTNATSVGIKLAIKGPSGCTAYARVDGPITLGTTTAAASIVAGVQASGDISTDLPCLEPATGPGTTATWVVIEGTIANGANAGNLILRHGSETATATTILANSRGVLEEIA